MKLFVLLNFVQIISEYYFKNWGRRVLPEIGCEIKGHNIFLFDISKQTIEDIKNSCSIFIIPFINWLTLFT